MRPGRLVKSIIRRLLPPWMREAIVIHRQVEQKAAQLVEIPPGQRVMVLAPHMDDEVIGCGGTLAKHAERGCFVTVAVLTDGSLGDPETESKLLEQSVREQKRRLLTKTRKEESLAAARCLGVKEVLFLDFPDGALAETPNTHKTVAKVVADIKPDLLYAPFFMDQHSDHRAAAELAAGLAQLWPELLILGYEVWTPLPPTCLVDISNQMDRKREALSCFATQLRHLDFKHTALGLNAYRSMHCLGGRGFVEAFFAAPAMLYSALSAMTVDLRHKS